MGLVLVIDFYGVGYLEGCRGKKSNQKGEVLWDWNWEFLSEFNVKFLSPTLY